jgi:hypothetical protein
MAAGMVKANQPPPVLMYWSEVVAAIPLTLQYIGFAPTLVTATTAPVGSVPLESDVVTVTGVPRAPDVLGVKPPREAENEPAICKGVPAEHGTAFVPFQHILTTPCASALPGVGNMLSAAEAGPASTAKSKAKI